MHICNLRTCHHDSVFSLKYVHLWTCLVNGDCKKREHELQARERERLHGKPTTQHVHLGIRVWPSKLTNIFHMISFDLKLPAWTNATTGIIDTCYKLRVNRIQQLSTFSRFLRSQQYRGTGGMGQVVRRARSLRSVGQRPESPTTRLQLPELCK